MLLDWRDTGQNRRRKELMLSTYLWDEKQKMFFDYDFKEGKRSDYVSATAFYPFWAFDPKDSSTRILPQEKAAESMHNLLQRLELPGGLAATDEASLKRWTGLRACSVNGNIPIWMGSASNDGLACPEKLWA